MPSLSHLEWHSVPSLGQRLQIHFRATQGDRRLMLPPSACPSRQEIRTHLHSGIYKPRNSSQSPGRGPEPEDHVSNFIFLRKAKRDAPSRTVQTFKLWIRALGAGKLSQKRGCIVKLGPEHPLHRRGTQGMLASGHTRRKRQRLP